MNKTFHITTFGCQMNEHDSEIMAGLLTARGFREVPDRQEASVEILNTCSVRENADKRFFGTLGQLKRRKMTDPDYYVCVCGCMMQQQHIIDRIKAKYAWVDLVFGTHNIARLPVLLENVIRQHEQKIEIWDGRREEEEPLPALRKYRHKALVNIMYGCNNFCTYCIVPYTRGREQSRPPEDVLEEIRRLAEDGVCEVMLLGQNVNSYRGRYRVRETARTAPLPKALTEKYGLPDNSGDETCTFAHLVRMIADIDGIERIRFMTSHPKDLSDELIATFEAVAKLCRNIHLPVQSGSSRVLKRMNRHYDRGQYLDLVRRLRDAVPDITISTDVIVGFPGETEEDFLETLSLMETVRYDSAFTFLYSIREGTPAARDPDQIPEDVKHERFNRLVDVVDRISAEKNAFYEGRTERVLIEGRSKRARGRLSGRTDGFKLVNFSVDRTRLPETLRMTPEPELADELEGRFADVLITSGKTFSMEGELRSLDPQEAGREDPERGLRQEPDAVCPFRRKGANR